MITIEADFDLDELNSLIDDEVENWFEGLVEIYKQAGIDFVERAVAKATFNNITWNLRSSIGYLILYNGQVVDSYFKDLVAGTEGQEVGEDYALFVAKLIDEGEGLSMALVAGEEYAYYVEAKNRDVISGSYAYFETELKGALS